MAATPTDIASSAEARQSSTRPTPSTSRTSPGRPRPSRNSSRTRTSSSSMPCTRWPMPCRSRRTGVTRATSSASSCASSRGPSTCACTTTSRSSTMRRSRACSRRRAGSGRSRAPATEPRSLPHGTGSRSRCEPRDVAAVATPGPTEEAGTPRWFERWWITALVSARGRPLGIVLLIVLAALVLGPETRPVRALRVAGFDLLQSMLPRVRVAEPAVIVAIDEPSLKRYGQWPWPRTVLAKLVTVIAAAKPAAIALDILMPEPDRVSPGRLLTLMPGVDPDFIFRLQRLPGNDIVLADAVRGRPVVVGVAGIDAAEPTAVTSGLRAAPVRVFGVDDPRPLGRRFPAALRSVDEIDTAAPGHALVGVELDHGVARRIALIAAVGPTIMPTLGLEMLRLAMGESTLTVHADRGGIRAVGVGDLIIPTQPDGSVFIRFSHHDPARFVSAADVLDGTVDKRVLERKLVLVGVTAHGLTDQQITPVGDAMSGAEIHAQFLEGLFDTALLSRPSWARWLEAAVLVVGGLLLLWLVPALPVWASAVLLLILVAVPIALATFSYGKLNLLHDAAT